MLDKTADGREFKLEPIGLDVKLDAYQFPNASASLDEWKVW
jgi:hypothetical protein